MCERTWKATFKKLNVVEETSKTEAGGWSKKALKGGLAEQLEKALEWGRAGQALRRHQGDGRGNNVTVER